MIDSESRSQVRPLESFKRSRFGLLAIASIIIRCGLQLKEVLRTCLNGPNCKTGLLPARSCNSAGRALNTRENQTNREDWSNSEALGKP
jgi:hypothetical protein